MQVVQEVCHPDFPDQTALLRASLAAGRLREEPSASAAKSSYFAEFCQVDEILVHRQFKSDSRLDIARQSERQGLQMRERN